MVEVKCNLNFPIWFCFHFHEIEISIAIVNLEKIRDLTLFLIVLALRRVQHHPINGAFFINNWRRNRDPDVF